MVRFFTLVATIAALSVAGCTSRIHYSRTPGYQPPPLVRASVTDGEFAYKKQRNFTNGKIEKQTDNFWVKSLSMASSGDNGQVGNLVTASYFQSKQPGAKPLVIILPIWGVHTFPSNALSDEIRSDGGGAVNILQIHGQHMLFDLPGMVNSPTSKEFLSLVHQMADRIVNTVIDIRRVVDWAEGRPEIDRNRIALAGFSFSAIVASVTLANEPRITAGVLVMGGANLHDAFATCDGIPGRMRNAATNRFEWSVDQFRNKIKVPLSRIDPARFAGKVDPRRLLIIEAGKDTCLPASGRRRLWEAMGRPERIVYQYDHRISFMAMTFLGGGNLQQEAFLFLKRVFNLGATSKAALSRRPGH